MTVPMLVTEITTDRTSHKLPIAICFWYDFDRRPHFTEFPLDLLEPAEPGFVE
jgi:hypothetical protein